MHKFLKILFSPAVIKHLVPILTALAAGYTCGCQFKSHPETLDNQARPLEGIEFQTEEEPLRPQVLPLPKVAGR